MARITNWEHLTIENFVETAIDLDDLTFDHTDLAALAQALRSNNVAVSIQLEGWGLKNRGRAIGKSVRTFKSNDNDRWTGPGSEKCHGGSGFDSKE